MRNKPTMVHAKPTAQNSTAAGKTRLSGLGGMDGKGQSTDATLPRFRLVLINALPVAVDGQSDAVAVSTAHTALPGWQHVSK